MLTRPATVRDVPAIAALISPYAQRGLMLFRSHAELYEAVRKAVGEQTGRAAGKIWGKVLDMLATVGGVFVMCGRVIWLFPKALKNPDEVRKQAMELGVASMPLIFVTSLFIGMVSAVSAKYQFRNMVPLKYLGTSVTKNTGFMPMGTVCSDRSRPPFRITLVLLQSGQTNWSAFTAK